MLKLRGIRAVNSSCPRPAYMPAFSGAGLTLERFDEPMPKRDVIAAHRSLQDFHRLPHFWTMAWRAPK